MARFSAVDALVYLFPLEQTLMKWNHEALFDHCREKVRIQCKCGKQSPLFAGESRDQQAAEWYKSHVGLKEQLPKKREVSEE